MNFTKFRLDMYTSGALILTNDGDTPVLPNVAIKCTCCKRVLMLKKYTEKKLLEHAVSDRFYI